MGFDWRGFIAVAQQLHSECLKESEPESKIRCAVSRYYYGAFCYTRDCLADIGAFHPEYKTTDHSSLRENLRQKNKASSTLAASKLETLHDHRKTCDYDANVNSISPTYAQVAYELASEIIESIQQFIEEWDSHHQ